jgi:hypothetical protein
MQALVTLLVPEGKRCLDEALVAAEAPDGPVRRVRTRSYPPQTLVQVPQDHTARGLDLSQVPDAASVSQCTLPVLIS